MKEETNADVATETQPAEFPSPKNGRWFGDAERLRVLANHLSLEEPVRIVDIGANPVNGNAPYQPLLDAGLAHVTGFEPDENAFDELQDLKSEQEQYLCEAVGDGKTHTIHLCRHSGLNSLLELNPVVRDRIAGFSHFGQVMSTGKVKTRRLDDLTEIEAIDFLKIDVQGAELMIFENGRKALKETIAVQTEVAFVKLYKDQPSIVEVLGELNSQGFELNDLVSLHRFKHTNSKKQQSRRRFGSQLIDGDIVVIRNLMDLQSYDTVRLKKFVLLADAVFRSFDLVVLALDILEERNEIKAGLTDHYFNNLFHKLK